MDDGLGVRHLQRDLLRRKASDKERGLRAEPLLTLRGQQKRKNLTVSEVSRSFMNLSEPVDPTPVMGNLSKLWIQK
jgi:hypothetical protein